MNKEQRTQFGFTLIEVALAIGLTGLFGVLVAAVFFSQANLFNRQTASISTHNANRIVLDEMVQQIRASSEVVATCAGCGGVNSSANVLILKIASVDSAGNIISNTFDYIIYRLDLAQPTNLTKQTIADPASGRRSETRIISADVWQLQFTYNAANFPDVAEVTIDLTTTVTVANQQQQVSGTTKAVLRNL